MVGYREVDTCEVPNNVSETHPSKLLSILEIPPAQNLHGESVAYQLMLSDEARAAWLEFAAAVEVDMRDDGYFTNFKDWGWVVFLQTARIAGLFHIIDMLETRSRCKSMFPA